MQGFEPLIYEPLAIKINNDIAFSDFQKVYIEIIPLHKKCFEMTALFEFIDSLTIDYDCIGIDSNSHAITIYAVHHMAIPSKQKPTTSIKISITNNFQIIRVYIRDGIKHMSKVDAGHLNHNISFKPYTISAKNLDFYNTDIKWDSYFKYNKSVLYQFGKFIADSKTNTPIFLKYSFKGFQTDKTKQRNEKPLNKFEDFFELIHHLPGFVYYEYKEYDKDFISKCNKPPFIVNINNQKKILISFTWLMPWVERALTKIQYIEIDASFKACKPYKYCIWHGICYNSSIPFAVTLFPTETWELYELIYKGFEKFNIDYNYFEMKPVLSDMGPALEKFCKLHCFTHFICHRHLIENFGSNSAFGFWVAKLLSCKTKLEYEQKKENILAELNIFIEVKLTISEIDKNMQSNINNLQIMLTDPDELKDDTNPINIKIKESPYFVGKWAIWERIDQHVGRCTNHSEGAHGNINSNLKKKGKKSVRVGISVIADYIIQYLDNRKENYCESYNRRHVDIIHKIVLILNKKYKESYKECANQTCSCGESEYNKLIFGVTFPCLHTVLYRVINGKPFQRFCQINNDVDVRSFFLHCLMNFPHYKFEFYEFQVICNSTIEKIVNEYKKDHKNLEVISARLLALDFLISFTYQNPPYISCEENKNFNVVKEKEVDCNISFDPKKKFFTNENLEKSDDEFKFWFKDTDNEIDRLIKQKYYETKYEITKVYDKLANVENICFTNYFDIIQKNEDLKKGITTNIVSILANFKIECWKMADELANGKNFFG